MRFVYGLSRVTTLSDVADITLLTWDTVKEITKKYLAKDYGKPALAQVRLLAIDEIYLGKRKRFYTIVLDLESGHIVWVKAGRGKASLKGFWRRLRNSKAVIEAVATDMSAAYWSAVLEHLPNAALIFDHFHVIKLMNERLDELRRQLVREAQGVLKLKIKGTRFLLLRNFDDLKTDEIPQLDEALKVNEPLLIGWYLKEELHELWKQGTKGAMKEFLEDWCSKAEQTGIGQLMKMAKTLRVHARGILAYADYPITSGKMEGTNNKIRTLLKVCYGLSDESYFILRLLALHDSKHKLP